MSFTLVQSVIRAATALSNTFAVTSTGAGNLGVFFFTESSDGGPTSIGTITGGGTWVSPAGAITPTGGVAGAVAGAYCLSLSSGTTSFTVHVGIASSSGKLCFAEYSFTSGPITFDTASVRKQASFATSYAGVTLTLSGSNDVIIQCVKANANITNAGGAPWNQPITTSTSTAIAGRINTSVGTAPTWAAASSEADMSAMAFKESSSTNVTVAATGQSVTATAGIVSTKGNANVSAVGSSMTATAGTVTATPGVKVAVTGNSLTITAGTVSTSGAANVTAAGSSMTATAGAVSVKGAANVSAAGNSLSITAGSVTISGSASVAAAGNSLAITAGSVSVAGSASVSVTGNALAISTGNVSVSGDANIAATGNSLSITAGDVSLDISVTVAAIGNVMTITTGSVSTSGDANVSVTGNLATITAGTVTVTTAGGVSINFGFVS